MSSREVPTVFNKGSTKGSNIIYSYAFNIFLATGLEKLLVKRAVTSGLNRPNE